MIEKTILTQTLSLDTAPIHVPAGGSILCKISGNAKHIAALLEALREEIAYGMADIETLNADSGCVRADIYFGAADAADFDALPRSQELTIEHQSLPETTNAIGLSMRARNDVINALKRA